jgi:hypothetical protein
VFFGSGALGGINLLCMLLFAMQAPADQFASRLSIALVGSSAALVIGGLLGFLFGIPKTLQKDDDESHSTKGAVGYRPNTNLEQISDWLTKILVGIGLTQVSSIREGVLAVGNGMAAALGGSPLALAFSIGLLVYGVVLGFLVGFLLTRLFLAGALKRADVGILEARLDEVTRRAEADSRALALVLRQLNPSTDDPKIDQAELDKAMVEASDSVRAQIFYQAKGVRSENWREQSRKPVMERTIPIFRALIKSDTERQYHQNHAQLGFALKDGRSHAWSEAEKELTEAIVIRGPNPKEGYYRIYEVARAMCVIEQDREFVGHQASTAEQRQRILEDLRVGYPVAYLADIIARDSRVKEWMTANQVTEAELAVPAAAAGV